MTIFRSITRILRLLFPRKSDDFIQLNAGLTQKKRLFKAPPLSTELVVAIRLIAPHFVITDDEKSRDFWEKDQNASSWGEDQVLSQYLGQGWKPKKILEIGPGLGRSVVFLQKKYNLKNSTFYLYEGTGKKTKYTINGPKFLDSFCGNIPLLKKVLEYNRVSNYKMLDAKKYGYQLTEVPGTYDLIYSFYAVGFHWNIDHFLDDILAKMKSNSLGFFLVPAGWKPTKKVKQLDYKITEFDATFPPGAKNKMLILRKKTS